MKPLLSERARNQRWRAIRPFLRGAILDIGCGWTTLPELFPTGTIYMGVDKSQEAVDYFTGRYPQHSFYLRDLDDGSLDLGDRKFDTVILAAVVEHLQDPEPVLRQARELLVESGLLVVTTPSPLGESVHGIGSRLGLFYQESVVVFITRSIYETPSVICANPRTILQKYYQSMI